MKWVFSKPRWRKKSINNYCWMIDLGSLKSSSWLNMTNFSKMSPQNGSLKSLSWLDMTNFSKMSPPKWPRWSPSECGEVIKIIEKCWNDVCWVCHGRIWWFPFIETDISGHLQRFLYVLYRKWLKVTFCFLPTCSTPQRKLKFAGDLFFTISIIFWNFGVSYTFKNQMAERSLLARPVHLTDISKRIFQNIKIAKY